MDGMDYCEECEKEHREEIKKLIEQLKAKEQECEELKEEIKEHNDDMFKKPPEKRFYCKGCTLPYITKKQSQTLTEIKEIVFPKNQLIITDSPIILKIQEKISECEE